MISEKITKSVLDWKAVNDIDVSQDELTSLLQAEWQEWHESNHADLFEVADICFVVIQLKDLMVKQSNGSHHTSHIEASHLLREKMAYKHLDAVIKSNWTKYMPIGDYDVKRASDEAQKASIKYKDRYTQIMPRLSACKKYYFLIGLTKQGVRKIIKPSCFIGAEKFL